MRSALERRQDLIEYLNDQRFDTIDNLSYKFDVSRSTIKRDLMVLSLSYPVSTKNGIGGGAYMEDWFDLHKHYLNSEQQDTLKKVIAICSDKDAAVLTSILKSFSKSPKVKR